MPEIDFCFNGWVRGASVTRVHDAEGKEVDVSAMSASDLAAMLNGGQYFVTLGDYLYANRDAEIEMFDFAAKE